MNLSKKYISAIGFRISTFCAACAIFSLSLMAEGSETKTENKLTVFITGANRGLGLEFAKQYSERGYNVIGTARKPEEATELKKTGARIVKLDVTSDEDIAAVAKQLAGQKIDILLNNAGYRSTDLTRKAMITCFTVNTLGPLFVSEALLPNLKLSTNPKIINISSRSGKLSNGSGKGGGYSISKTALNMLTRNMFTRLKSDGFIVISLAPGHNKTDMGGPNGRFNPKDSIGSMIPFIEKIEEKHSGGFWYYDGSKLDW